jgi:hypothetical protein
MDDIQTEYLRCVSENICIRLVCASCVWTVLRCVFCVSVGIYIQTACMFGKCLMWYESFIHSIDMCLDYSIEVYASNTLNAYFLHFHIYESCVVCVLD